MISVGSARFEALGTNAVVLCSRASAVDDATAAARDEIDAIDRACSRFMADSELMALNEAAGRPTIVSSTLFHAIEVAVRAAALTGGRVDPTVGGSLRRLGYDRDFRSVPPDGPPLEVRVRPAPGWRRITLDRETHTVVLPVGVELDLGATAKALAADLAAEAAAGATDAGVLVSLGGDLSIAGPAVQCGWTVLVADDHASPVDGPGPHMTLSSGGLATSGTTVRRWQRGGRELHHVVDPESGAPVEAHWRTVSVAASSCVDANIASTACVVMGAPAAGWLEHRGLPGRLVARDGDVHLVGDWPVDRASA
jgi:thiamine biosynthesis lipoprotein